MANRWKAIRESVAGAAIMGFSLLTPFLNSRRRTWGVSDAELAASYPGDELVPNPKGQYTHGISINASTDEVWPWLVQIGQNRAGFYSYELLENLIGCKMSNADRIVSEWQRLEVEDDILMHPTMGVPWKVAAIEPGRHLLLEIRADLRTQKTYERGARKPDKYQDSSWLLFLVPNDDGTTRLISRSRNDWNPGFANTMFYGVFGVMSMEMDRKMLLGIKERAEKPVS